MPIYEYKCEDCNKITEIFLKSKENKETPVCKHCGSKKLTKQISAPGAVIMGSSHPKGTTCCGRIERCDTPPPVQTMALANDKIGFPQPEGN